MVFPITCVHIVIAAQVNCGVTFLDSLCHNRMPNDIIHSGSKRQHQTVDFTLLIACNRFLAENILDNTAHSVHHREHRIDTTGNRTGRVKLVQQFRHLTGLEVTGFCTGIGNFIADTVGKDTGVVIVFFNHCSQVVFPVFRKQK